MKFFSFKTKKRPPMSRVIPYDVEIVTRRTCQAYTWSWRVANGKGLNPQQGARVDALVRQYCTARHARQVWALVPRLSRCFCRKVGK